MADQPIHVPSPEMPSSNSSDELQLLTSAVHDLQSKRLTAIRLYHEEKSLRQQECARVSHLTVQLNALQHQLIEKKNAIDRLQKVQIKLKEQVRTSPANATTNAKAYTNSSTNNSRSISNSTPQTQQLRSHSIPTQLSQQKQRTTQASTGNSKQIVQTSHFWADVRRLEKLPYIAAPSLTWHSLSMQENFEAPEDLVFALLHSLREPEIPIPLQSQDKSTEVSSETTSESATDLTDTANKKDIIATKEASLQAVKKLHEEIADLKQQLKKSEEGHGLTKKELVSTQRTVEQLKEELELSRQTFKGLAEAIRQQEESIPKLSI